jgi:hypothetical protein
MTFVMAGSLQGARWQPHIMNAMPSGRSRRPFIELLFLSRTLQCDR